jgi:fructose-1,6-bisphosphatase/inositol monophosphatase family enzyme
MGVSMPRLQDLDQELQSELAALADDLRARFLGGVGVDELHERQDGDTTHAFDIYAEERIIRFFAASGLPVRISSEERPDVDLVASPELLVLLDPLDGSQVAARGYPMCSIALSVVDMATATPALSRIVEVFTGVQYSAIGGEARKDGRPMRPSTVRRASDALVVSYFASGSRMERLCQSGAPWGACKLVINYGGLLDIAKVGSGQCDAMIEVLKGFVAREYVAGMHIAQAAGAIATTLDRRSVPVHLERNAVSKFVVAATAELHDELLELFGDKAGSLSD